MTDERPVTSYDQYCAALDAWSQGVHVGCAMMKAMLTMRGHAEAIDNLGSMPAGSRLTGPPLPDDFDARARRLLARYDAEFEPLDPMPGLDMRDSRFPSIVG